MYIYILTFLMKNSFNCESSNLIYVVICEGCKEGIYRKNRLSNERANKYLQTKYKTAAISYYKHLAVEEHLRTMEMESSVCFLFSRLFKKINY